MKQWRRWRRDRWFVLAVVAVAINALGVGRVWLAADGRAPAVLFRDGADGPVQGQEALVWQFGTDQVTPELVGMPNRDGPYVIHPAVDGQWMWTSPRRLVFQPDAPWTPCRRYEARGLDVVAQGPSPGPALSARFAFHGEPLRVESVSQIHLTPDSRLALRLAFNAPPRRDALSNHLRILSAEGGVLPYRMDAGGADAEVIVRTTHRAGASVMVQLRQGLPPDDGDLVLPADVTREIRVQRHMALTRIRPMQSTFEQNQVGIEFSQQPDMGRLTDYIAVEPALDFVVRPDGWGCALIGNFEPGASYRITLRAGLPGAYGSALREDVSRMVTMPDRPSGVSFPEGGRYLSGAGRRLVTARSVNTESLTVTAERIYPNNLVAYALRHESGGGSFYYRRRAHDRLSRVVGARTYPTPSRRNQIVETTLDLRSFMGEDTAGAYWLTARADTGNSDGCLVVVSDLGIHVRRSDRQVMIWVNALRDARPVAAAEVTVISETNQELAAGVTDAGGVLAIDASAFGDGEPPLLVLVRSGGDWNYLPLNLGALRRSGDLGGAPYPGEGYEAAVFTERGIFRPGETGRVHVVVRGADLACPEPFPVTLRVIQPDQQVMRTHQAMLSAVGTAVFTVAWPEYAATGKYGMEVLVPGGEQPIGRTAVHVEAFAPPAIAVDLHTERTRGQAAEPLPFSVKARHLFGPPAAGLPVRGAAVIRTAPFQPEDWDGFTFGDELRAFTQQTIVLGEARLDDAGRSTFALQVPASIRPPAALDVLLQGKVTESGGRAVSAYGSRPVDVYPYYLGIRPRDDGWPQAGEDAAFEVAAVRPDGAAHEEAASVEAELYRVIWSYAAREVNGRVTYENTCRRVQIGSQSVPLAAGRGRITVATRQTGAHELLVHAPGIDVATRHAFYVSQPGSHGAESRIPAPDVVTLVPDQPRYRPGDTARIRIETPFAGTALLTIETDRILERRVLQITNLVHEVDIPVDARFLPNAYCCLTMLRPVTGDDDLLASHRAVGAVSLAVEDPVDRLAIAIEAPATIRPQSRLQMELQVRDADGRPVQAEVVLAAVDEGICRMTDFQLPDPLSHFRRKRALGLEWIDIYGHLLNEAGPEVEVSPSSPAGDQGSLLRGRLNPVRGRRFRPTALHAGPVMTDATGRATVSLDVPEFAGELRLMAIAVAPSQMGATQHAVVVKRPLVVQSSLPRFLAPEDRCDMPVQVFNQTGAARQIRIRAEGSGPLSVNPAGQTLSLAAGDSGVVVLDVRAGAAAGPGGIRLAVEDGEETYQEDFELPVRPASPRVTLSGSGAVAPGEVVEVAAPTGWLEGTETFDLWCSGLPSLAWAGGLDYLLQYPYGCLEQTVSATFPLLYLADLAAQVQPGSIEPQDTDRLVQDGIWRVLSMQASNGGFRFWPEGTDVYPWGSAYAADFLVEAARLGHPVPADRLDRALACLGGRLDQSTPGANGDAHDAWLEDRMLRAYACRVLTRAGKPARGWLDRLLEEEALLPLDARIHLAAALAEDRRPADAARLLTAIPIDDCLATTRAEDGSLQSPPRTLALLLSAWVRIDPLRPVVPALVRRLEETSENGRWQTTQDNAMALLALGEYSRVLRRGGSPAVDATIACGAHTHTVPAGETIRLSLPDCGAVPMRISNQGGGTVYYAWRAAGVPVDADPASGDHGCQIRRRYLSADGEPLDASAVPQGQSVWVELTVSPTAGPLRNLAIVDLLPAGLEIEQTRIPDADRTRLAAGPGSLPVQHVDARDDRMVLFTGGIQEPKVYRYLARAVTPGRYRIPPAFAEGMYTPGLSSLHGGGMMQVIPYPAAEEKP